MERMVEKVGIKRRIRLAHQGKLSALITKRCNFHLLHDAVTGELQLVGEYEFLDGLEYLRFFSFQLRLSVIHGRSFRQYATGGTLYPLPIPNNRTLYVTQTLVLELVPMLQRSIPFSMLAETMQQLTDAVASDDFSLITETMVVESGEGEETLLLHRSSELLLCHLILLYDIGDGGVGERMVRQALFDLLRENHVIRASLITTSVQEYVATKLRLLGPSDWGEEYSPGVQLVRATGIVNFTLPPFGDDPTWNDTVETYNDAVDDNTYEIYQLSDRKKVSIVARTPDGTLLGYVTCSMHVYNGAFNAEQDADEWWQRDYRVRQYANAKHGLYNVLSVDGLFVLREVRGGERTSIATLLVFMLLFFVWTSSAETGIRRVACYAGSRTTAVIMSQFGAMHLNAVRALSWMERRLDEGKSIGEDLSRYTSMYAYPLAGVAFASGTETKQLKRLWKHHKKNPILYSGPLNHLRAMSDDERDRKGWDTFLYVGAENETFTEQMRFYYESIRILPEEEEEEVELRSEEEERGVRRRASKEAEIMPEKRQKYGRLTLNHRRGEK
jgi:hypothetical protein